MTADRTAPRGRPPRRNRAGFTLIEIMIVVVIIAVLVALLVPAVGSAIRTAREGEVRSEISRLESSIADFKAHFGINPPSYIDFQLYNASGTLDPSGGSLKPATVATLTRLWPNINIAALVADLQANPSKQRYLDGPACLVFFLGGMVAGPGEVPNGFSVNPRSPLNPPTGTDNRVGPFIEFELSRLYDKDPTTFNGYEGYLDTLPDQRLPYFYITNDRYKLQETANAAVTDPTVAAATMRPVYRQSASSFFNSQSYQIISPGPDGVTGENDTYPGGAYGIGGVFDASKGTVVDALPDGPTPPTHPLNGQARGDADNITNFHSGKLIP